MPDRHVKAGPRPHRAHPAAPGLPPDALRRRYDPAEVPFTTTDERDSVADVVGQARALRALEFGMGIARPGYNIFALGAPGTGKRNTVLHALEARAARRPAPPDLCYVHNFDDPRRPALLTLPAGSGVTLHRAMERLVEELRSAIRGALESEDYQRSRDAITQEAKEKPRKELDALAERAKTEGLALVHTPGGFVVVVTKDGEPMTEEAFAALPAEEQARYQTRVSALEADVEKTVHQVPRLLRRHHDRLRDLRREVTRLAVTHLMDEVRKAHGHLPGVTEFLNRVEADVVEHAPEIIDGEGAVPETLAQVLPRALGWGAATERYGVNVLVSNAGAEHAPVITEDNPTYDSVLGRIEHVSQLGALVTDFTLIKAGALHRASGGYLVLDANQVLRAPFLWDGLKRALRSRRLRIETLGQALSLVSTVSLEPEPVPLDVQVVLLGDPTLYYLLAALDPDFPELFKVAADFDDQLDATPELRDRYLTMLAALVHREALRPFDRGAVARLLEESARIAGHREKLTTRVALMLDLLRESDYWAGTAAAPVVGAGHVQQAVDEQIRRADRLRDRVYEEIARRTVKIDTAGARVGQVNGIAVSTVATFTFGRPTRITARVRVGKGDVVDIEREVELGGPIHSKGVLILGAYVGARYSPNRPLSLAASLVFEQSYAPVEGDSASAAELFALLSAVAEVPLRQSLGVTGSVNQHGDIQAVGAINEKIEGFFDVCRAAGLTGEHGVIIPADNVQHLMLRQDVVDAVAAGRFHVHPIRTVDEGLALLTGLEAGARDALGEFPPDSFNRRVETRCAELAETVQAFAQPAVREPE